jgi:fumarate reductase iron-sulfur subunit
MKITIKRKSNYIVDVPLENITLLEALNYIKTKKDPSLTFSSGCRSSVCGSCSLMVNDKPQLACEYKVKDGDFISPLTNLEVIKDLVVDHQKAQNRNKQAKAWINQSGILLISSDEVKLSETQSNCILCSLCYAVCPVYAVNDDFLGPFALTRILKYTLDKRDNNTKDKIDHIQNNGVWDCTLCDACTFACPVGISSKQDIEILRMQSAKQGYVDPNFANFGGGLDFGAPQF